MATPAQRGFRVAARTTKVAAIVLGALGSYVSFASLVGIVTGNAWARGLVALILTIAVPLFAVDRALPKGDAAKARPGLLGDVAALVLLGIALLFVGLGQPVTRPLLVREGDRLAEDGHAVPAHVVYFLAGVRPVDAPASASAAPATSAPAPAASSAPPAPNPTPSASASAGGGP